MTAVRASSSCCSLFVHHAYPLIPEPYRLWRRWRFRCWKRCILAGAAVGTKRKRGSAAAADDGASSASDWAPDSADEELEAADAATDTSLGSATESDGDASADDDASGGGAIDDDAASDDVVVDAATDDEAGPSGASKGGKSKAKGKTAAERKEEEELDEAVAKAAHVMINAALAQRAKQADGSSLLHDVRAACLLHVCLCLGVSLHQVVAQ